MGRERNDGKRVAFGWWNTHSLLRRIEIKVLIVRKRYELNERTVKISFTEKENSLKRKSEKKLVNWQKIFLNQLRPKYFKRTDLQTDKQRIITYKRSNDETSKNQLKLCSYS